MAVRQMSPYVTHWMTGLLVSVVMVAAVTGVVKLLEPIIPPLNLLTLYMPVVVPVALVWGTRMAVATTLLCVATYFYLFVSPEYTLKIDDWRSTVALGVFLVTAVVVAAVAVGELAARLRRATIESASLAEEQSALRRVATLVAQSVPPSMVFEAVTREVGLLCRADLARMERYEADDTVTGIATWSRVPGRCLAVGTRFKLDGPGVACGIQQSGGPVRVDSYASAAGAIAREARTLGIRSSVGCPIVVAGRLWGAIAASTKGDVRFPADTESQIARFTELVATAVQNAEARAELMASRARIAAASDETRRSIERDLHDGVQQRLVSLTLQLRTAQATLPPALEGLHGELDSVAAGLVDAIDELREMASGIHPAILAEGGLVPALKALARRSRIPVDLHMHVGRLPEQIEVNAYYVVSEALTNVAKHAHASAVAVTVEIVSEVLRVAVHDDGIGGADVTRGTGLLGLKDRVEALDGRIHIDSRHGAGTTLRAELPLIDAGRITSN